VVGGVQARQHGTLSITVVRSTKEISGVFFFVTTFLKDPFVEVRQTYPYHKVSVRFTTVPAATNGGQG
jgi:hypothetical protein